MGVERAAGVDQLAHLPTVEDEGRGMNQSFIVRVSNQVMKGEVV